MAGRVIAQMLLVGGTYVARAFIQAYQQAIANSARNGGAGAAAAAARNIRGKLTAEQASEILGVDKKAGLKDIYTKYDRLFNANDPAKGGSIYLQAKLFNAKTELEKQAASRGEVPRPPEGSESTATPENQSSKSN